MQSPNFKAIVTGGSDSLGRATALALTEICESIVISYQQNQAKAEETVAELQQKGVSATAIAVDFSHQHQVNIFAEQALDFLNNVDILINNAAMISREKTLDLTPEKLAAVFQVNTIAPFSLSQKVAQSMIENNSKGSIINISSIAAMRTFPRGLGYATSKAALNKLTENLALDLAPFGIRVNAIAPGVLETGMNANTKIEDRKRWDALLAKIPLGRAGMTSDIVNLIMYLLSDKAEWITGQIFNVNGGQWN